MEFPRDRISDPDQDAVQPMALLGIFLKVGAFIVLLAVGLKLTFWAVDVIEQVLYHPDDVAVLRPLMNDSADTQRGFSVERTEDAMTFRDHNALSLTLLVGLLIVLFNAIGRAIAALIGGAVRLLASIDFKRNPGRHDRA